MSRLIDLHSKTEKLKDIIVKVNNRCTDLQIGDKLQFPAENPILKTVASITVFEDGSCNYLLKWYDDEFKQEMVSLEDLKLLEVNVKPRSKIGLMT